MDEYGYNAKINPKKAAIALKTFANIYKNEAAKTLQAAAKRRYTQPQYIEDMNEEREANSKIKSATTINNAIRNQLAKRELNKLKANKEEQKANAAAIINNAIESQLAKRKVKYLKMSKEAKEKYKSINPSYNLEYKPPLSTEPFVPKFIQDANERKRKNMELYKRYEKTYYPSSNLASSNESLAKASKEKNAANKLKQAYRSHLAKKELINRQIEKNERNNAATNLQRVYKGHLGRKEATTEKYRHAFKEFAPSLPPSGPHGSTTASQLTTPAFSRAPSVIGSVGKIRKQRSDKGIARGPYKEKRPVGRPRKIPIPNIVVEGNRGDYESPAARNESGTGLRGRHHPKKRMVKTTKEQDMKNRLFLITKEIKAGNDNFKLIAEADKLYKELYGIENAHLILKK